MERPHPYCKLPSSFQTIKPSTGQKDGGRVWGEEGVACPDKKSLLSQAQDDGLLDCKSEEGSRSYLRFCTFGPAFAQVLEEGKSIPGLPSSPS